MARPKGSKNKNPASSLSKIEAQLVSQQEAKKQQEMKITEILAVITEQRALLKDTKKQLRTTEKQIASLETKKATMQAEAEEEAKKEELDQAVATLLASGESMDDILARLKK